MGNKLCNNVAAIEFIQKFKADATHIAIDLRVPLENILGLAAEESNYGKGRIATEYNNYFSMHAPAPGQTGAAAAQGSKTVKVATYDSFLACGQSFSSRYGRYVEGKNDPTDFANALVEAGYNPADSKKGGRDDFVEYLVGIINACKVRLSC